MANIIITSIEPALRFVTPKAKALIIITMLFFILSMCSSRKVTYREGHSEVLFKENRLYVNGNPFFFFGVDGVVDNLESMRRHHVNTIFSWNIRKSATIINEANRLGIMIIPYLHGPSWNEEMKKSLKEIQPKSAILAWNIGDDLTLKHLNKVKEAYNCIRKIDPNVHRPMMLDSSPKSAKKYANFVEMYSNYTYPLLKSRPLSKYREYLINGRQRVGMEKFFWTWIQAHTQIWYSKRFFGKTHHCPSFFPDAEHLRLLTYEAISAGVRGILYYNSRFFKESWYGKDRYAELGILGAELEMIGPFLAEGEVDIKNMHTLMPENVAVSIVNFSKGKLIILVKEGKEYQYQPDMAIVKDLSLSFSKNEVQGKRAYSLDFPNIIELKKRKSKDTVAFILPSMELTSMVLLTKDNELLDQIKVKMERLLPDVSKFAIEVLEGKKEKVEWVERSLKHIPQLEDVDTALKRASNLLLRAKSALQKGNYRSAYLMARMGQRILRVLQHKRWSEAWHDPNINRDGGLYNYYLLPRYYQIKEFLKK